MPPAFSVFGQKCEVPQSTNWLRVICPTLVMPLMLEYAAALSAQSPMDVSAEGEWQLNATEWNAQNAPPSRLTSDSAPEIPEVIVTARRREENSQKVPIAISAFSADELTDENITSIQDLSMFVPSLAINNSAGLGAGLVLRGQGTILGAPPGVIVYFAEVPMINLQTALGPAQGGLSTGQFYDLTSLDVLKGPQGTLFGRNTTGGALIVTPQKPTDHLEGFGQLTLGAYDWREFEGAFNVPIIDDRLLVRVACDISVRDGYTTDVGPYFPGRDYDNRNYQAVRFSVLGRPTADFENYFVTNGYSRDQYGAGGSAIAVEPDSLATAAFPGILNYLAQQSVRGPRETSLSTNQIDRELVYGVFDIAQWRFGAQIEVKNVAAYQTDKNTLGVLDSDYTGYPLQDTSIPKKWGGTGEQYSEELQVRGALLRSRLEWVVGTYFEYDRPTDIPEFDVTEPAELSPGTYSPILVVVQGGTTQRSRAGYGQTTYELGDVAGYLSHLKLTTGARYTWDDAAEFGNIYIRTLGNTCAETSGVAPACLLYPTGRFSAPTWTVGLDDQLTDRILAYITNRRGYKSGGFNLTTPLHAKDSTYGPEFVTDVELGVKADWELWGVKARSNLDIFHSDYTDVQRTIEVVIDNISGPLTENAASATIDGIEWEQVIKPTVRSELLLSYSYLQARYDRFLSAIEGNLTGQPFPYSPRNKGSVSWRYSVPLSSRVGTLTTIATYAYQSAESGEMGAVPYDEISGYGLLNLRANWRRVLGSSLEASVFVTNATNKTYVTKSSGTYTAYGVAGVTYGEPRMLGVQLRYSYGP